MSLAQGKKLTDPAEDRTRVSRSGIRRLWFNVPVNNFSVMYIKVAKLRTGVGSADMSHQQNCSLKIYLKRALGVGGGSGCGGHDGCERRIKVFVKFQKKIIFFFFFWGGGGGAGGGGGGQGICEQRSEVFV